MSMLKSTLRNTDHEGKRVLLRVDWDVPMNDGNVLDDTRVIASLETLQDLLSHDCAVTIVSHLGRPKGREPAFRLEQLLPTLEKHHLDIQFVDDIVGDDAKAARSSLKPGQALLLQNVRFDPRETANDVSFAKALSHGADLYVNDAFGVMHRKQSTQVHIPEMITSCAGYLVENEVEVLSSVRDFPDQPFIVIMGGIKIETKLGVLINLAPQTDEVLVGGGIATAIWAMQGRNVGSSKHDVEQETILKDHLTPALLEKILLPTDIVIASADGTHRVGGIEEIGDSDSIVDIGPKTIKQMKKSIKNAHTVIWNGPMGWFEDGFIQGTEAVARMVADSKARTIVGGGETTLMIHQFGLEQRYTHVSTGGGAMLQFLEGKPLPGLDALPDGN